MPLKPAKFLAPHETRPHREEAQRSGGDCVNPARGIAYVYENDDYMFLVLSEDPAWAEEALAALP